MEDVAGITAVEIEEAVSVFASDPFDAVEFPFAFLAAFGNKETTIKRLRTPSANTQTRCSNKGLRMAKSADDLRDEYLALLTENRREQDYQRFMELNTRLIPREFVQNHGIACSVILRKVTFGSDYKTDFFFLSKSTDDWNAVFIEIEKPSSQFFKEGKNEFGPEFTHALQQIGQWRAWLETNQEAFLKSINTLRVPPVMRRNPTRNKFVLVFGRRAEYANNELRQSLIRAQERDDFKIMTFDSLAEGLEEKGDTMIGVRRNEYIDLMTDEIVSRAAFAWLEPTEIRVSDKLWDKLKNGPRSNSYVIDPVTNERREALGYFADRVRRRSSKDETDVDGAVTIIEAAGE